jgi:hypothetical protein
LKTIGLDTGELIPESVTEFPAAHAPRFNAEPKCLFV